MDVVGRALNAKGEVLVGILAEEMAEILAGFCVV